MHIFKNPCVPMLLSIQLAPEPVSRNKVAAETQSMTVGSAQVLFLQHKKARGLPRCSDVAALQMCSHAYEFDIFFDNTIRTASQLGHRIEIVPAQGSCSSSRLNNGTPSVEKHCYRLHDLHIAEHHGHS